MPFFSFCARWSNLLWALVVWEVLRDMVIAIRRKQFEGMSEVISSILLYSSSVHGGVSGNLQMPNKGHPPIRIYTLC